jgi:two-component system, LytTR family, sensor kinase
LHRAAASALTGQDEHGGILAAVNRAVPTSSFRESTRLPVTLVWLGVWAAVAAISATLVYVGSGASDFSVWVRGLKAFLAYWYIWAAALIVIHRINRGAQPRLASIVATWPWHLLLFCGTSVVTTLSTGTSWRYYLYGDGAVFFHGMNVPVYLLLAIGSAGWILYRASIDRERDAAALSLRAAQLEAQLDKARMQSLRAQIHPHVLFNALNSIAALIRTGRSDECYRMTELLASLLRTLLDESAKESVLLDAELEFVARYLELESIRFRDRLKWKIDVAEDCRFIHVPPFLIQPLVENSIKHAVEASQAPVSVNVRVSNENSNLLVCIEDDGPGLGPTGGEVAGVGIANVRERLRLVYGAAAELQLLGEGAGLCVRIRIPAEFPHERAMEAE